MLRRLLCTPTPHPVLLAHRRTLALLIFGGALVVYLVSMTPGVAGFDAGEFQFVPYVLGLPHPTGYPLYTLFGKLWTIVEPFGPVSLQMNLLSAIAASAASALTFLLVFRITERAAAGMLAALTLALNSWYWSNAIIAGVRPIHILLVVLTILLALDWSEELRSGGNGRRRLSWLALCIGVGLAHHRTFLFLLPGLLLFIGNREPKLLRDPKRLMQLALLVLLPVTSYLYVLVRGIWGAPFAQLPVYDLESWWALITGSTFSGARLLFEAGPMLQHAKEVYDTFALEFSVWTLLLGAAGFILLAAARPREFCALGGAFLLAFVMVIALTPGSSLQNSFSMNLQALVPVFIGLGASAVYGLVAAIGKHRLSAPLNFAAAVASMAFGLWWVAIPASGVIQAANSAPLSPSRVTLTGVQPVRLVEDSLPRLVSDAMVLGDWTQITPFWYYQYINGMRRDVRFYYSVNNWRAIGEEEHKFGRPLYLTRKVPEMLGQKHLGMTGPLIRWAGETQAATAADMQRLDAQFGDGFVLLGYRQRLIAAGGWNAARPYIAQLSLWWQASRPLPKDYAVSLRLVNAEGRQVAQADSSNPVLGLYPTSQWDSGEIVEDYYELRADPADRSAAYHVEVLVYWNEPGGAIHNLPLGEGAGDRVALAPLPTLR